MPKKLPIGISSLSKIIQGGYVYVDKTRYVYELVNTGEYYFLSRPRRFGKSLFVDTLKEAFEGNKDLFKGLWLYDHWDWEKTYPVIHISFAEGVLKSKDELNRHIIKLMTNNQKRLQVECEDTTHVAGCFSDLIVGAKERYKVPAVILIDEYDKPILDNITDLETAREMREGLKNLYAVIKGQDANIKFVFLTGVSKFSKVSIFSGLNNLKDITINKKYSSICGYTERELIESFKEHLIDKNIEDIRHWYNGYNWTGDERVYNPFSILNYLSDGEFRNYWFESGTPTFLIELFKQKRYYIPQLENLEVGETLIGRFDIDFIEPENLLFQAGYLTIIDKKRKGNRLVYALSYPNLEVRQSLTDYILSAYHYSQAEKERAQGRLYDCLIEGDIDGIREVMRSHFASIPYEWHTKNNIAEYEGYYASVFYSYFASIGIDVRVEESTSYGKVDMAVIMPKAVYVFEFKCLQKAGDRQKPIGNRKRLKEPSAIEQLRAKGYAEKYRALNRPIYLIGIEFSKTKRQIVGFYTDRLKVKAKVKAKAKG